MPFPTDWCISVVKFKTVAEKSRCKHLCRERVPPSWANTNGHNSNGLRTVIPGIQLFQNLTLEIQGQGHGWGQSWKSQHGSNIQSTHIPFVSCQSGIPFLGYNFLKIWPWKSRVKVMGNVKVQSHNVGLTSYRLTSLSFHVNRPSHSWDTAFSKFDMENQGSRSWVMPQFKVTMWV